jgi:hypothetical protein
VLQVVGMVVVQQHLGEVVVVVVMELLLREQG